MSCVAACTVPDCLGLTRKGRRALSPWLVPAVALSTMLAFWGIARATGFWQTSLPAEAFRLALPDHGHRVTAEAVRAGRARKSARAWAA